MNISSYKNYIVNSSKSRNFITSLGKTGAILPVVLLEATVTGGRTYQAYKRDGFVEARERVTEESLGAVFWLFGATMFGKLIEAMGRKTLPLSKEDCDVGEDAVRKPFKNMCAEKMKDKKFNKELFAKFKFGKIIASLVAACAFIGFVVPKMNQAITKKFYTNRIEPAKELDERTLKMRAHFFHSPDININSVQNFKSVVSDKTPQNQNKALSFKGAEFFTTMAQNFEQNAIYKLLGTDVGTVTGRTANARNKDERVEILFRDLSSIYFYCFSTPAILAFLNNKDVFKGANTKLNPNTAMDVHNHFINAMKDEKKTASMPLEDFKKFALGADEDYNKYYEKFFPKQQEAKQEKILGIIPKKAKKEYRVLNLEDYNKIVDANFKDAEKAKTLKKLGQEMSELQPQLRIADGESVKLQSILTESQVEDILKGGEARRPSFMKKMLNSIFSSKKQPDRISDKYTYIPQGEIEAARERILGYVDSVSQLAAKEGKKEVDWDVMLNANKRNKNRNGLYWGAAMGVSALFLSTIIPKVQYWITKMRTGRDGFPGIENYREQEQKKSV